MMTKNQIYKLREYIQFEVRAGIADSVEDESVYTGTGYAERKDADRVFAELLQMVMEGDK